jgi:hypothetical protein
MSFMTIIIKHISSGPYSSIWDVGLTNLIKNMEFINLLSVAMW